MILKFIYDLEDDGSGHGSISVKAVVEPRFGFMLSTDERLLFDFEGVFLLTPDGDPNKEYDIGGFRINNEVSPSGVFSQKLGTYSTLAINMETIHAKINTQRLLFQADFMEVPIKPTIKIENIIKNKSN